MQLAEGSGVGEEIRSRFDHVLVDEFQDTNVTQYRLLRALSGQTRNLAVVGDDDQSIYRWRGADVRIIRGFRKDFPDATVIKLEQNYRSSGNIVAAGLGVIGPSREREPKRLWTDAPAGRPVQIVAVTDEREEAGFVVRSVQRLLAEGVDPRQIGIFYRIHAQSRVLEEAFRSVRIPYQIIGGMRFFERAEVKDVLAYLRLVDNPRSDADLLRIVNVPSRGIGDTTVKRLLDVSAERGSSAYEAIPAAVASGRLGSAAQRKLLAFSSMIGQLIERATTLGAHELAREVLDRTGYRQALRNDDSAESDARLENIAELLGSIAEYESEALHSGLEPSVGGYLERTALFTATDGLKDAPSVALMTVHAAKGLEFDTVVLSGMEEEIFPYQRMGSETVEELDEERRLAYVAVTRARRLLIITHAAVRTLFGMTRYRDPSRFLDDIPTEVADRQGSPYAQAERHFSRLSCRDRYDDAAAGDTGQRTIDPTFADPLPTDEPGVVVRAGDRVRHRRFGEGIVQRVEVRSGLTVVARFPGFGEKRILAEYLELG
jgi:DNA helicase-2/ATP-dependent DNA helicase PcrA